MISAFRFTPKGTTTRRTIGYDVPTTGGPEGAEDREALQAARDAVVAAERAVAALKRRIAAGDTTVAAGAEPLPEQLRYLERDLAKARDNEAYLKAHTGPRVPAAEVAFLPRFPARVETLGARVGAPVAAPLVTLSTGTSWSPAGWTRHSRSCSPPAVTVTDAGTGNPDDTPHRVRPDRRARRARRHLARHRRHGGYRGRAPLDPGGGALDGTRGALARRRGRRARRPLPGVARRPHRTSRRLTPVTLLTPS